MSRKVRIGELKAKLSEHLRYVRKGGEITVLDRETPVATISPHSEKRERLVIRPAAGKVPLHKMKFGPPLKTKTDIVALLLEDRNSGR